MPLQISAKQDDNLARRLQRREPDAIAELYDRFGRIAYSIIAAIVRDNQAAEDLVQETFLHAWNEAHAFEPGSAALGPWVLAIARNRALDHVRPERGALEHPSLFAGTEREALDTDRLQAIRKGIAKLEPKQQKLIQLAYYEGLSQNEMAERIGEPLETVKTLVRSALRHLREELGQTVNA